MWKTVWIMCKTLFPPRSIGVSPMLCPPQRRSLFSEFHGFLSKPAAFSGESPGSGGGKKGRLLRFIPLQPGPQMVRCCVDISLSVCFVSRRGGISAEVSLSSAPPCGRRLPSSFTVPAARLKARPSVIAQRLTEGVHIAPFCAAPNGGCMHCPILHSAQWRAYALPHSA